MVIRTHEGVDADVQVMIHPNPRTWKYQRSGPFRAFAVLMYVFGLGWMFVNLRVMRWFIQHYSRCQTPYVLPTSTIRGRNPLRWPWPITFRWSVFQLWVLRALAFFMVAMPCFGAMVVIAIKQEVGVLRKLRLRYVS